MAVVMLNSWGYTGSCIFSNSVDLGRGLTGKRGEGKDEVNPVYKSINHGYAVKNLRPSVYSQSTF